MHDLSLHAIYMNTQVDDSSLYTKCMNAPMHDLPLYAIYLKAQMDDSSLYTILMNAPMHDLSLYVIYMKAQVSMGGKFMLKFLWAVSICICGR